MVSTVFSLFSLRAEWRYGSKAVAAVATLLAAWATPSDANPLNLAPGTPATVTLGQIATLANFNTAIATGEIAYSNTDLATRQYVVRLPSGYNAADPAKKYGLVAYIDAGDAHSFPASYAAALDAHDMIWLGGQGIGNTQSTTLRRGVALMGAFRLTQLYPIDPARVYASGLSGGGRTASDLAGLRHDVFRGFIGRVGASIPGVIPGWESAGTNSTNADANYETGSGSSVVLPAAFRTAIMTQTGDFRRAELLAIYRWGHLNHGNTARAIVRPGGHSDEIGPSFTDAVRFLYHPLVDVIWDRFENASLAANVHPGKTAAGSGFTALSGDVAETTHAYNSVTHGVLRLAGDGALAEANDTFAWKNDFGILLDARLRSQFATTAGQNQQIGLHLVAEGSTGPVSSRPGFHLTWGYGAPHRAEIVSTNGLRRTLATWEHAATHPMALPATNEKTFWGDTAAPDFAGKTKSFRGEDVRLVLNATGFQLTFNRYADNVQTSDPDIILASNDAATPYAEHIPMTLQGLWASVETALVDALPSGNYRLLLSNSALVTGQPVGTALVDEIRLVGSSGQQAAPATLTVTAPANGQRYLTWSPVHGALGYTIERSTSPDSGFTALATVPNVGWTAPNATSSAAASNPAHTDPTASASGAYYYRVAALGVGSTPGRWSATAFAARSGTVPAAPAGLSASPSVFPSPRVALAWTDAATTETAYRVERSPAGFAQWTLVSGQLAAGSTSFTDTTVLPGAAYDYRVSAVGAAGLSAFATITANIPDAAPPTPAGLAVTATTFTSASLTWNTVPQASTYRVKRGASANGPFTTLATGLTAASYTDATLTPGQTYHYVVSAVGAALESADSSPVSATTPELLPPANLAATPGFTTVSLAWTAAPGVSTHRVERAPAATGPFVALADNLAATTFTDTGLATGVTRFYRVLSLSGAATSSPTSVVSATPIPGVFLKTNNTTSLDQPASWSPAALPTLADTVSWNGTYATGAVSVGVGLSAGTLRLLSPSTAVTVDAGTGQLTLGSGGVDLSTSTQNLSLNTSVALAAGQTWSIPSGRTLTLASPLLAAASPAPALTLSGTGTLSFNGTGDATLAPGPLFANGATLRVNQASANLTLSAANFPAGSGASFASLTGAVGARLVLDAAPAANLAFASNTAGFTLVVRGGNLTYHALSGNTDATNLRLEGGVFAISPTAARYQLAAANQTLEILGGTLDATKVTSFGFRVGGSGSASQAGAQNVVATQSGGTLLATTLNLGGNNTTSSTSPSYALSGGTLALNSTLTIGADTTGNGTSTFTFSGGTLRIPGTLSGAQTSARQIFAMSGGTLAAATVNFTHLRSADAAANGSFTQSGGTLAPGGIGTSGRTQITGNYTLGGNATLAVDLGGTTQASAYQNGQYDLLAVTGATRLDGALLVSLLPGFTPSANQTFTVLTSTGAITGGFSNLASSRVSTSGGEGTFLVSANTTAVLLSNFQPALTPLQSWRQTHFGQTTATGPAADTADPDADGANNLLEYALGTDPVSPASAPNANVRVTNFDGQTLALSFLRSRAELTYLVEASSTLDPGSWIILATNPGAVGQTVTVSENVSGFSRRFLRLRVTSTP